MPLKIAFDIYGTLFDTQGVVFLLKGFIGNLAEEFSLTWRNKQLEYSFRKGLMQDYQDFSICTRQALDYTSDYYLKFYKELPPFPDTVKGLSDLVESGHKLYAFSNGKHEAIEVLLKAADLRKFFTRVVSVDNVKSFKPDPSVYRHFLRESESNASEAWLVSSNPFDVIGATSAGLQSAWVKRSSHAVFDPWGIEPTITVADLVEFSERIS
ncbi:MAG: haloacid dehalogenase type II [Opitutae bacterium]|nr:haloacid dehalogenase type II [Opitutae bacterium]